MDLTICELDAGRLEDVGRCVNAFTVDSRLVLSTENGVIHYTILIIPPYLKQYSTEKFDAASYIANPDKVIYLAYCDGGLAGQVRVGRNWNRFAYIEDIVVDSLYRKRGIGRALLEQAILWARVKGYPGVMLETQDINAAACRLYEQCGMMLGGFDRCLYRGIDGVGEETALYWYLIF